MDELRVAAKRFAGLADHVKQAAGVVGAEAAAREEHLLGEGVPFLWIRRGVEFGERVVEVRTEVFVRHVTAPVPYQPPLPRQQPFVRQPVERREYQALGQVSGGPEEDEDRRPRIAGRLAMLRHSSHPITLFLAPAIPALLV
jgi:hypothetical protein